MTTINRLLSIVGAIFITALLLILLTQSQPVKGSVVQGQEYYATSTAQSTIYGSTITSSRIIKGGYGSLGSVVITGANTGIVNFYDATTSDVTARTGNKATSTILIASLPASLVAGTYTFDAQYGQGLYIDIVAGNAPTSTITYR